MSKKIVFIGGGNMATAIIGGILMAGLAKKEDIIATAPSEGTRARLTETFGITAEADNVAAAKQADVLVLAIKPQMFAAVLPSIRDVVKEDALIISIAAGQSIAKIEEAFGRDIHLVRVMPNTPALVGEAMSAYVPNTLVTEEEKAYTKSLLESFGQAEEITENLMDAVIGVSGSSPAYVYMFIEAMADAAVVAGLPRAKAYKFAAQSVYGSAKMVLETGKHPGELKDQVCSPAGTTIAAVAELEKRGFRGTVMAGELACIEKSRNM